MESTGRAALEAVEVGSRERTSKCVSSHTLTSPKDTGLRETNRVDVVAVQAAERCGRGCFCVSWGELGVNRWAVDRDP